MRFSFAAILMISLIACRQKPAPPAPGTADTIAAPSNSLSALDKSPMDMSWLPDDFPAMRMKGNDSATPIARVIYSRPHRKNRNIFGNDDKSLVQYGKPWRLGANEATEIHFFRNVSINNSNVPAGAYVLYCIPHPDSWTIVLNSNLYSWGLAMKESADILRTEIPVSSKEPPLEDFTMVFKENGSGADLVMAWANVKAALPIVYAK